MIRIITDSAADLEPYEYEQLGISCIPLTVNFGEDEYRENVDLSKTKFYELLLSKGMAKTSQAAPEHLINLFEQAHAAGDEAIYITLSSALSGTYQNALMIKDMLGYDSCHVIDSLNATGGQRLIVQHAAKLRDEGKSVQEIIEGIEDVRGRIVLYACMDTLQYLYMGGRISQTVYKLGSMARIKPIISVDREGRVAIPAKAMGMRKGMDYMCKRVEETAPCQDFPFYVMYTNNRDVARELAGHLEKVLGYKVPEERIIPVGAAIGSHVGPEACGLVYIH